MNSSHVGNSGAASPQRAATITPVSHAGDKDVMLLHIEPRAERPERPERPERHERHDNLLLRQERHEPLLDLSVKRPRHDQPFPHPNKSVSVKDSFDFITKVNFYLYLIREKSSFHFLNVCVIKL